MLDTMKKAARAAGAILKKYYGQSLSIKSKGEKGIVTRADKEAEKKILSILNANSDFSVIAEESGTRIKNSPFVWVVDPLDGTTNFSRNIPFFCTSIALMKNNRPHAAVIYHPLTGELFSAEKGMGAFLNGVRLKTAVTNRDKILVDVNKGYSKKSADIYLSALKNIFSKYTSNRLLGSSALELAYVAAGRLDCFITYGDELYDVAAGVLIAEEAGCKVSNWMGKTWKSVDSDLIVSSKKIYAQLIPLLSHIKR